jgi:CubicO group peptidase (beta-lactamase class C family)
MMTSAIACLNGAVVAVMVAVVAAMPFIAVTLADNTVTAVDSFEYLDLSQDFEPHPLFYNDNVGAKALMEAATTTETSDSGGNTRHRRRLATNNDVIVPLFENQIQGYLVLEQGLKVAEYYNPTYNNNMTNTTIKDLFSINKSFTGLCFGIMEQQGLIQLSETLGDIWPSSSLSDSRFVWGNVTDAVLLRQSITIESLLTQTSGFDDASFDNIDFQNLGGATLTEALNFPVHLGDDLKGNFAYLAFANILSYVVYERTNGTTIQDFMQQHYFDFIGVLPGSYNWTVNAQGMGYSRNGLSLSIPDMAKWGQTYLQKGYVNPTNIIVAEDWVDRATTGQVTIPSSDLLYQAMYIQPEETAEYGYMVPIWTSREHRTIPYYCAYGASGQYICVWPTLARVAACQTNSSGLVGSNFIKAVDRLSFNSLESGEVDMGGDHGGYVGDSDLSSASSGTSLWCVWSGLVGVGVVFFYAWL